MLSLDTHYKRLYLYAEPRTGSKNLSLQQTLKRVFDVCFSLIVTILVLTWMIPLIGLLIQIDSPGPIIFKQKRTGYHGIWFYCFKFRTMVYNPNETFKQAKKNDSRITTIGRFLRKTNMDEMPQFINVLIGNMSIVGPRPHPIQLDIQYWNTLPKYRSRYRTKPGITGLAQTRGCRGETEQLLKMDHRIKYDRMYIRKQSLFLDVRICWWTIKCMIKGDNNAF
jgi:putative colanic acid biosynthesis UDP-glucose lipid carrier transferase